MNKKTVVKAKTTKKQKQVKKINKPKVKTVKKSQPAQKIEITPVSSDLDNELKSLEEKIEKLRSQKYAEEEKQFKSLLKNKEFKKMVSDAKVLLKPIEVETKTKATVSLYVHDWRDIEIDIDNDEDWSANELFKKEEKNMKIIFSLKLNKIEKEFKLFCKNHKLSFDELSNIFFEEIYE